MVYLKFFHLTFLFTWLGTLLTSTRTVGVLAKQEPSIQHKNLRMWRRFYFLINIPLMVGALITGVTLLWIKQVSLVQPWLHLKLTCVFFLVLADIVMGFLLFRTKETAKPRVVLFKILHAGVLLFIMATLFAIYVLKK